MMRLLKEPLVQFLIVGVALFATSTLLPDRTPQERTRIVIPAGQVEHLAARFARTWRRPPTAEELQGLVDDYVREEVAVREGLAMGLDTDDTIIRRRIRQKLDFIASDVSDQVAPTPEELAGYLAAHPDDFRIPPRYTFLQVFFDPSRHAGTAMDDARTLLEQLRRTPNVDLQQIGDPTLLDPAYEDLSPQEIAQVFGEEFARALEALEWPSPDEMPAASGRWTGPIASGSGLHLIRPDRRVPDRVPQLDEIRDTVRREWEYAQRNEVKDRFYEDLLERYDVTVEWPSQTNVGGTR